MVATLLSLDDGNFESGMLCGQGQGLLDKLAWPAARVTGKFTIVDVHRGRASALRPCLQNYSNVHGSKLKWNEVVVHKNDCRDCVKHVAMERYHIAVALRDKAFREDGDVVKDKLPTGPPQQENHTVQFLAFQLDTGRRWTARELKDEVGVYRIGTRS